MGQGLQWYEDRERQFTDSIPERAHMLSAAQAAGVGAQMINSSYTGSLARDVATPKRVGSMHAIAGSELPHARIENDGGTIRAKNGRMLIRGRGGKGGRGRTTTGGLIAASATEVEHKGKHYLEAIAQAFPRLFIMNLRRMLP